MGITDIFTFFLDNLNSKLARPDELDLNPNAHHVRKAVLVLSQRLAERQVSWLPHEGPKRS